MPPDNCAVSVTKPEARASVTNGSTLLAGVDGRSTWARRLRDLIELHTNDLGGELNISEAEKAIVRRASVLVVELERMETGFALAEGAPNIATLDAYQRAAGNLRRLLESLGLERRPRDVTPTPTVDRYVASLVGEGKAGNPLNAVTDADRAQVILAVLAENPKMLDHILKQLT